MAGDWQAAEGTDLAELLLPFAERMTTAVPAGLAAAARLRRPPHPEHPAQLAARLAPQHRGALRPSNDLFATFLDETMSYSSALFDEDQPLRTQSFEEAQLRKVHAILDMAKVGQDSRVLEIGTGWGTLALEAARRGATVTSVTLSKEQAAPGPPARGRRRASPTPSTSGSRTTARSRASTTPSSASR